MIESISFLEWLANNYTSFGATLEIITNKSQEGSQFCKGFGGIGGLLRYKMDFMSLEEPAAHPFESNSDAKESKERTEDYDDLDEFF